jgi:hypothetical protein
MPRLAVMGPHLLHLLHLSGWRDLNPRPRAPKARALAKLRYSPSVR